jgi:hypothetical protein
VRLAPFYAWLMLFEHTSTYALEEKTDFWTAAGRRKLLESKTHTFATRNVRYVRDYLNGSTANTGDHWVEMEVWGTANTAYVGNYFEWMAV